MYKFQVYCREKCKFRVDFREKCFGPPFRPLPLTFDLSILMKKNDSLGHTGIVFVSIGLKVSNIQSFFFSKWLKFNL